MPNSLLRYSLRFGLTLAAVLFSHSLLRADTQGLFRDQAVEKALVRASNQDEALAAENTSIEPAKTDTSAAAAKKAATAKEEEEAAAFRQTLRTVVTEETEEEFHHGVESYIKFMPLSGVDAQSGKVGLIESAFEYNYNTKVAGKLPVELSLQSSYISVNNSTVVKLPARLTSVVAGADVTLPLYFDRTYIRIGIRPSFHTDNWSFYGCAFRIPQYYLGIYQPNDKLTLLAGAYVTPRYENLITPIVGLIYKASDKLLFNLVPQRMTITYDLNKQVTLFAEGELTGDEYNVGKDGVRTTRLNYSSDNAGVGVTYSLNKYIQSSLSVGGVFNRNLQYQDSLGKVNINPGFYTSFRVEAKI